MAKIRKHRNGRTDRARLKSLSDPAIRKAASADPDSAPIASVDWFRCAQLLEPQTNKPSPKAQRRVAELIARAKGSGLSAEENAELDHFMELEHILRMAKARARQKGE